MTQIPSNPKQKRGAALTGAKIFVASCGMAVTLGAWGIIANKGLLDSQNVDQAADTPTAASDLVNVAPLPTIMPLRTNLLASNSNTTTNSSTLSTNLRVVAAPQATPEAIVQKPVVQEIVVGGSASVSAGGGGGKTAPAAKTKSSK